MIATLLSKTSKSQFHTGFFLFSRELRNINIFSILPNSGSDSIAKPLHDANSVLKMGGLCFLGLGILTRMLTIVYTMDIWQKQ